jgi:hypothetical protein
MTNWFRLVALVLAVVLTVVLVQPARAEALEPTTIILIASAAVAVVLVIAVVIIANIYDTQQGQSGLMIARAEPTEAP